MKTKLLTIALLSAALAGCGRVPEHNLKVGDRVVLILAPDGIKGIVKGNVEFSSEHVYAEFYPYSTPGAYHYRMLKVVERPTQPEAARQ